MLGIRTVLALAMIAIGCVIIVRMFSVGFNASIVPGVVLGAAMAALGFYRLKQIRDARSAR